MPFQVEIQHAGFNITKPFAICGCLVDGDLTALFKKSSDLHVLRSSLQHHLFHPISKTMKLEKARNMSKIWNCMVQRTPRVPLCARVCAKTLILQKNRYHLLSSQVFAACFVPSKYREAPKTGKGGLQKHTSAESLQNN